MAAPLDYHDPRDDAARERGKRDKLIGRSLLAFSVIGGLVLVGLFLLRGVLIGLLALAFMDHAREDQGPELTKSLSERFGVAGFTDARSRKISGGIDSSGPGWTAAKLPPERAAALIDLLVERGMAATDAKVQLFKAAKDAPDWWRPRDTPSLRVLVDVSGTPLVIGHTDGAIFVDVATGRFWMWSFST